MRTVNPLLESTCSQTPINSLCSPRNILLTSTELRWSLDFWKGHYNKLNLCTYLIVLNSTVILHSSKWVLKKSILWHHTVLLMQLAFWTLSYSNDKFSFNTLKRLKQFELIYCIRKTVPLKCGKAFNTNGITEFISSPSW